MKQQIKVYLESEEIKKLKLKAEALNFKGKGAISHYISKIANEPICFIDENVRNFIKVLNLK